MRIRGQGAILVGLLSAVSLSARGAQPSKDNGKGGPPTSHSAGAAAPHPGANPAQERKAAPKIKEKEKDEPKAHAEDSPGRGKPSAGNADHERKDPQTETAAPAGDAPGAERAEFKSAVVALRERHAQGKLDKDELKSELAALRETRGERRRKHGEALKARWGNQLAQPSAQEELRHHERRMASLERLSLLAETERSGPDKEKLVARIAKLTAKENERHERKMTQLQAGTGTTRPASANEDVKTPGQAPAAALAADPAAKGAEK